MFLAIVIHLSSNVIYFLFRKLQETQMSTSSKLEETEHRVQVLQAGLMTLWILVGWEVVYFSWNLYGNEKKWIHVYDLLFFLFFFSKCVLPWPCVHYKNLNVRTVSMFCSWSVWLVVGTIAICLHAQRLILLLAIVNPVVRLLQIEMIVLRKAHFDMLSPHTYEKPCDCDVILSDLWQFLTIKTLPSFWIMQGPKHKV